MINKAKVHQVIRNQILLLFGIMCFLTGCNNPSSTGALLEFGKEQFLNNDFDNYIQELRASTGLSDLSATADITYEGGDDYDSTLKTMVLHCKLTFSSDKIDDYYGVAPDSDRSYELFESLKALKNLYLSNRVFSYKSPSSEWTVNLKMDNGIKNEVHVISSSGHDYQFSYFNTFDNVHIDGDKVCSKDKAATTPIQRKIKKNYNTSNSTKRTCIVDGCTKEANKSIVSPFSGEKEYYCTEHYNEIKELLDYLAE